MINKEEVYARARRYNKPDGRTIKALDYVFSMNWPAGTNLVVEFIKALKGLPYGDNGMSLDRKADCSQLVINVLYIWFGIDYLGSYTQSIYNAGKKRGKLVTLTEARPLSVILYKFSNRNPDATHAAFKTDASHIWHTRSKIRPLMESDISYGSNDITMVVDFLTDEQRASVTVQADEKKQIARPNIRLTKPYTRDAKGDTYIVSIQNALIMRGFKNVKVGILTRTLKADGIYGPVTEAAVIAFQKAKGLEVDGIVGAITRKALGL